MPISMPSASVIAAVSALKQSQAHLEQARNRLQVMTRREDRSLNLLLEEQKRRMRQDETRKSIERERRLQMQRKAVKELEEFKNSQRAKIARERQKEILEKVKKTFLDSNSMSVQAQRQKRQQHELYVKTSKNMQRSSKEARRMRLSQSYHAGRQSVSRFRDSRVKDIQYSKVMEVEDMKKQILVSSRYKQNLFDVQEQIKTRIEKVSLERSRLGSEQGKREVKNTGAIKSSRLRQRSRSRSPDSTIHYQPKKKLADGIKSSANSTQDINPQLVVLK